MTNTLKINGKDNWGFFFNCTSAVYSIVNHINRTGVIPHVDFSDSFANFKADTKHDIYDQLFTYRDDICIDKNTLGDCFRLDGKFFYSVDEKYKRIKQVIDKWFTPNKQITDYVNTLIDKYDINTDKTLCICYRGTDKHQDIEPPSYDELIDVAIGHSHDRVFIQTDQQQFLDRCITRLGPSCIYFDEHARSTGDQLPIFKTPTNKRLINCQMFLATVLIMAKCRYIIYNTSNVTRWTCLYRGSTAGTTQFLTHDTKQS